MPTHHHGTPAQIRALDLIINVDQANVGTCTGSAWCGALDAGAATLTITNNILYGTKGALSRYFAR